MLNRFRRGVRSISSRVWVVLGGGLLLLIIVLGIPRGSSGLSLEQAQSTINAAVVRTNSQVPTIAARLTQTPESLLLTQAAPTLALGGYLELKQYAAAAAASSEYGSLDWGALQVTGPPNTPECGDFRSAWASAGPQDQATLTLYFAEAVTPTGLLVHETYNPDFVRQVTITDLFGEVHLVYQGAPQLTGICPFILVIPICDADYQGKIVSISLDQRGNTAGWNQIDAVELIGLKR